MKMRRRMFLMGAAATALVAVPVSLGGTVGFLKRTLRDHFGPDVLNLDGVADFVTEFASYSAQGSPAKKLAAEVYFAWHGDQMKMIGPAAALRDRFLYTILTRSNIIAVQQQRAAQFDYGLADPWLPACGQYLSAAADETL
ncbi:hypothetical protein [Leisingera aquimarina]|uniref:hypothetical protein n=1 Tax=Leisingera aquimarina TaxID=476529 RepID=UPI0003F599A8|nr:hypothetical protein [Leisingera aquimarina]